MKILHALVLTLVTATALTAQASPAAAHHITYVKSGDGDTLRAIFFENSNFTGRQLRYYGSTSCTSTTSDADYSMGVLPPGWNDIISSVKDYASCDVKLYTDGPFAGASSAYVNYGSSGAWVGARYDDRASSFRVS